MTTNEPSSNTPFLVRASILAAAKAAEVRPETLSRGAWRRHKPPGTPSGHHVYALGSTWEEARDVALASEPPEGWSPPWKRPLPDVPAMARLDGVSTFRKHVDPKTGESFYQWTKSKAGSVDPAQLMSELLEEMPERIAARAEPIPPPALGAPDDLLAVYPLGDPHIGMLAWGEETGDEDFDLEIAERLMRGAMRHLTQQTPRTREALIVNLGDYFHADTMDARTRRGGFSLDVSARWGRVVRVGFDIAIFLVEEALRNHEKVYVASKAGNHDDHSGAFLQLGLWAYFRNEPRVHIDLTPGARTYFRWGKNLLGVTHGHGKAAKSAIQLESCMSNERQEDWGQTSYRWWLLGHIHHRVMKETRGCITEHFRTLAPLDAHAAAEGYGGGNDAHRVVLHRDGGEVLRSTVSADFIRRAYAEVIAA